MKEKGSPLTLDEAIAAQASNQFAPGNSPILTFGISSQPVWIHLSVFNSTNAKHSRRLLIKNSWLDHLDVYFIKDNQLISSYNVGDAKLFKDRPILGRFFSFNHDFDVGTTDIYLRVETSDPIVIPISLLSPEDEAQREMIQGYSYGFIYGYLLALLAYNTILYLGLRNRNHLLYAAFITMFVLVNIAYTGHGFAWIWPDHVTLQRWIIPILMVLFGISGLTFAQNFLDIRTNFPRTYKIITGICALFVVILASAIIAGSQLYALLAAFAFVTFFSFTMLVLGLMSFYSGYQFSRYFLFASISSMLGTTVTALSVWGFISYSELKFRAVEIGMLVDASLLALALANQVRSIQVEHKLAERRAARDPLTDLYNRRSFFEIAQSIWSASQQSGKDLSVIMLDIDHFKSINDYHGHAIGDVALVATAKLLASLAREGDIVARWGGEEFLLLLPETKLESAIVLAERLQKGISEIRIPLDNTEITFTASFGVAYRSNQEKLESLVAKADSFLYQSKRNGRNRISSQPG